jgi:hypothetical protein
MTTSIFWFSRHDMDADQTAALAAKFGDIEVTKVNGTAPNVHVAFEAEVNNAPKAEVAPIKELIKDFDVIAVVAPIGLQQQFLSVAGDKPVIIVKNGRPFSEGEKVVFKFEEWQRLEKIEVVTSKFA